MGKLDSLGRCMQVLLDLRFVPLLIPISSFGRSDTS